MNRKSLFGTTSNSNAPPQQGGKQEEAQRLRQLEERLNQLMEKLEDQQTQPAIVIQSLSIEKVVVEHIDLNNNLGQLGIRELSGKLNIGAAYTYGKDVDESGNGTSQPVADGKPKPEAKPKSKSGGNPATEGKPAVDGNSAADHKPGGNGNPDQEKKAASASPGNDPHYGGPRIRFGSRT
ncbi:hypothetical protein SAMN04487970_104822 [Paenibacillus tianmuensis]|uniref:Spore germination protein GerPC n=1 Tax=Paenibacillus tianmuensis TaxID=624147 RepID=A0A1G4TEG8_9BACL|nr:hypothetical protein [Paenibacillus tianmuensis]SCW79135.1 hypothetical protein SAMN04487970_104822 [Paenibacillus tianmuensis]